MFVGLVVQLPHFMLESRQRFIYISWHRQVDLAFFVVPVEGDAVVFRSFPIFCHGVVLFECVIQVVGVFLANILYSKVIDWQRKADGSRLMFPEYWHHVALGILVLF